MDTLADSFERAMSELDDSGFSFKLQDVLLKRHRRLLTYLRYYGLARATARNSILPEDALCFPEDDSANVLSTEFWQERAGLSESDDTLLAACDALSQQIHHTAHEARVKQWQMAIAEAYLHTLSWVVQKTLQPTIAERVRQAIGK